MKRLYPPATRNWEKAYGSFIFFLKALSFLLTAFRSLLAIKKSQGLFFFFSHLSIVTSIIATNYSLIESYKRKLITFHGKKIRKKSILPPLFFRPSASLLLWKNRLRFFLGMRIHPKIFFFYNLKKQMSSKNILAHSTNEVFHDAMLCPLL